MTPASGPTGQNECYRAGSRWPSWCHTDSQIGFNCQGWSFAQWVCGGQGTPWVAGLKIGPDEERCDFIHLNDHAQHIFLSHTQTLAHTHGHKTDKIKDSSRLPMKAKEVGRLYHGPLSGFLSASLTHCLHSNADCAHAHTHTLSHAHYHIDLHAPSHISLTSPGHDFVPRDSSACAALTSVDSTVCHALSMSACAVIKLDCSQISCVLY